MHIRKTYSEVNPELLYAEIRDFVLKQGVSLAENKLETYTLPDQSASFVSRGTLTFMVRDGSSGAEKECLRVSRWVEKKLMLDVDDKLFSQEKLSVLLDDLGFIFGTYEME